MLEREREETILRVLRTDRFGSVHDFVRLTNASEATIRRDLMRLEEQGHLLRVRGGAELPEGSSPQDLTGQPGGSMPTTHAQPFNARLGIQSEQKRQIAKVAGELCNPGETVLIDGGSTTYFMANYLKEKRITVVTNSFAIAEEMRICPACRVVLAGGALDPLSLLIQDPTGRDFYADYSADWLFMSVDGITEYGLTNSHMSVIQHERQMISHSRRVVVLADSSKFRPSGHMRLCGFEAIDTIISDRFLDDDHRAMVREQGVELIIADS
ncbi:MAG: DeoR/GlpR family DNA-binding transcription regulator [Spirochaetaceae bacterium]